MVIRKVSQGEADQLSASAPVPTVSQLTRQITDILESRFDQVSVQGEITGWSRASSGHTYFSLKDENAVIGAVLWRSRSVSFTPRDGMKVIASGKITVYGPRGQYQLDCRTLTPLGQGELQLAFEQLKARLLAEGLFDRSRKKPLPWYPRRIGLVTSRTGAAVHDIITTLSRRMPMVDVVLRPALVQGVGAGESIAQGIREFNRYGNVDLLIVGRGGGSIEDLWAFNEEVVARAIFESLIPIISAVGHEVDFTIADFVADMRAATPTAAAEIAVRDREELLAGLREVALRLAEEIDERLLRYRRELQMALRSRGLARPGDLIRTFHQRVDDLEHRASLGLRSVVNRSNEQLRLSEATLRALNPLNVLARGYSIVERNQIPITKASELTGGDLVTIRMQDGEKDAIINDTAK